MTSISFLSAASRPHTRRHFLAAAAALGAAVSLERFACALQEPFSSGAAISGTLSLSQEPVGQRVPASFTGLSYESAQLANPDFFAAHNHQLVQLFRELSPSGLLRIGGGSSEYTTYSADTPAGPPPFEVFGPDTSKTVKNGTVTSALALRNLRGFLDAAGWNCLYGLNLGQGSKENAVAEAKAAYAILGPKLMALQIGNEPDSFRGRFRPASYSPSDYLAEWNNFHDAIAAAVPQAKFAGPDISNKLPYLTTFAEQASSRPDVILLTGHYYAMGPAGNPEITVDNLLSAAPKRTTMKWQNTDVIRSAMHAAHLPFLISEGNSCWNGGQAGISDVFASALWAADTMLHCASLGFSGFCFHGGGNGLYSPIVGSLLSGFSKRPEFFGIQFGQLFAGTTLLKVVFACDNDRVTAYAGRTARNEVKIAVINKTGSPVSLRVEGDIPHKRHWNGLVLTAPSLDAREGISLNKRELRADLPLQIGPYSGWVVTI